MSDLFVIPALVLIVLALLPAVARRSWKTLLVSLPVSAFGIVLPLFIFFFGMFLTPEWKGGCKHGWLDCFHTGKLALAPLVVFASAALYVREIYGVAQPTPRWIVWGFLQGTMVSSICFVFGLVCERANESAWWLLVPFYVSVWYALRTIQLILVADFRPSAYLTAICGSVPFWLGSVLWSRSLYSNLPNNPPSCFVVTAAARGHKTVVGPFLEIERHGKKREANRQLLTLWQFEAAWSVHAPRTHRMFRRFYNRLGPAIAARITSPWMADAAYILIKPTEFVAQIVVRFQMEQVDPIEARTRSSTQTLWDY
ncbi:MAG: hypothetical protein QOJ40_1038 [Verrucomicrobiota bacterium]